MLHPVLQVIAEAQVNDDAIDPVLLPANQDVHGEYEIDDSDDLLELLGNLAEYTATAANATKKSTENKYIEETVEAVENVGRFTHTNSKCYFNMINKIENNDEKFVVVHGQSILNESSDHMDQQLVPFVFSTPKLVRLNKKWQEQLKTEKERVRRNLITGKYDKGDDALDYDAVEDAIVTVVNSNNYSKNNVENCGSILPVISITRNFPTQKSIADEFTLNREQRAAFMIVASHLDGDSRYRTGILIRIITN